MGQRPAQPGGIPQKQSVPERSGLSVCPLLPSCLEREPVGLAQALGAVFGLSLDLSAVGEKLLTVVNTLFAVLTILGVVTDPTTAGVSDSKLALSYDEPKKN